MQKSVDFISQNDNLELIESDLGDRQWITICSSKWDDTQNGGTFSALVPFDKIPDILKSSTWDIMKYECKPSIWSSFTEDEEWYEHFYDNGKLLPIVLHRDFHGIKPTQMEILEEFRLFHNLYYKATEQVYVNFRDDASEEIVLEINDDEVRVLSYKLHEFAYFKKMAVVLFFDIGRYSSINFAQIPEGMRSVENVDNRSNYHMRIHENKDGIDPEKRTMSRFLGKRILKPWKKPDISKLRENKEEDRKKYAKFIIARDKYGKELEYTCNPQILEENDKTRNAEPSFVTRVSFTKEVLEKYFNDSDLYKVDDGIVQCVGLWNIYIDNENDEIVSVWLGYIGQRLPYSEQLHWRKYNVFSEKPLSKTFVERNIYAQFSEGENIEFKFKNQLENCNRYWKNNFGFILFREAIEEDRYLLSSFHIPFKCTQTEFDRQTLCLAKLLLDSINSKEIKKRLEHFDKADRSIKILERFLTQNEADNIENTIRFFKMLNDLRRFGAAHKKGRNYELDVFEKWNLPKNSLKESLKIVVTTGTAVFDELLI